MDHPPEDAPKPPAPLEPRAGDVAPVARLWESMALPSESLNQLILSGTQPALPSSFAVSHAAQYGIAAAALAAAEFRFLRTRQRQTVEVELRHAAIECRSDHYVSIDGRAVGIGDPLTGLYPCRDGWVRIHANFAHHRAGALALLECLPSRADITAALADWTAESFEARAGEISLPIVALRSMSAWDNHPQAKAVACLPALTITSIGVGPAAPLRRALHPGSTALNTAPAIKAPLLAGVRVLELTRILAGPVCGRALAAYGADVLLVNSPDLPNINAIADTSRGKRSCHIDLRTAAGQSTLHALLETADVFLQGYRPQSIAALGYGPEALAERYPGLIYASLSAYGTHGPWRLRRGFDSLVQTAAGFNLAEAEAAESADPKPMPTQILDHASGYLLAFGIEAALVRRAVEGGSWHVQVSLAQTAQWLRSLGRMQDGFNVKDPGLSDVQDLLESSPSGFGRLSAVRHAARFAQTPAGWVLPSVPVGTHPPQWAAV